MADENFKYLVDNDKMFALHKLTVTDNGTDYAALANQLKNPQTNANIGVAENNNSH